MMMCSHSSTMESGTWDSVVLGRYIQAVTTGYVAIVDVIGKRIWFAKFIVRSVFTAFTERKRRARVLAFNGWGG